MPIPTELKSPLLELNILRTDTLGRNIQSDFLIQLEYLKNACISESGCWPLFENSLSVV